MKIYLNAQFTDGRAKTQLLSLALVSRAGEFYRILDDAGAVEHARRSPWLRHYVLSRLPYDEEGKDWLWDADHPDFKYVVERDGLADDLLDFVDAHPEPELWGWHSAYAYVCIRRLFGRITERPAGFPGWCGDLATRWEEAGRPELPERGRGGHHALEMARWAMAVGQLLGD